MKIVHEMTCNVSSGVLNTTVQHRALLIFYCDCVCREMIDMTWTNKTLLLRRKNRVTLHLLHIGTLTWHQYFMASLYFVLFPIACSSTEGLAGILKFTSVKQNC